MAQIAKIEAEAQIKTSSDKFYNFFKNNFCKLSEIFPQCIKSVELIEGEEGVVGNIMLIKYELVGKSMIVSVKTEAVNDAQRSVTHAAIEGDIMQMYKIFKSKFSAFEGSVKWSIVFEKANDSSPNPDAYAAMFVQLTKLIDAYLLNH